MSIWGPEPVGVGSVTPSDPHAKQSDIKAYRRASRARFPVMNTIIAPGLLMSREMSGRAAAEPETTVDLESIPGTKHDAEILVARRNYNPENWMTDPSATVEQPHEI